MHFLSKAIFAYESLESKEEKSSVHIYFLVQFLGYKSMVLFLNFLVTLSTAGVLISRYVQHKDQK